MKDKVIETSGKIWQELGYRGQLSSRKLAHLINEEEDVVNLALGWLAREDKVACSEKRDQLMFALVESEMQIFKGFYGNSTSTNRPSLWRRLFR
jgi:hypothetical protein